MKSFSQTHALFRYAANLHAIMSSSLTRSVQTPYSAAKPTMAKAPRPAPMTPAVCLAPRAELELLVALAPAAEDEAAVEPVLPASVSLALFFVLSAEALTPVELVQCELYSELERAVEVKVTSVHCFADPLAESFGVASRGRRDAQQIAVDLTNGRSTLTA